jgi:hypothetical protein
MSNENWKSDKDKELDLRLENNNLEMELKLMGGESGAMDDTDPTLKNAFLKNVLAFEKAGPESEMPVRSLFPDGFQLPPDSSMSDEEIGKKLDEIEEILGKHNVQLDYVDSLPDRILYKHLIEKFIPHDTVEKDPVPGSFTVITGCHGDCESCFQKEYCDVDLEDD